MKNIPEELLWKYIDGNCSEEEKKAINTAIAEDDTLRAALAERIALHQALKKMEAEQPGMRFTSNVMENLPDKVLAWQPLLSPRLIGKFFGGLTAGLAICFLLVYNIQATESGQDYASIIGQVTQWSHQVFYSTFSKIIAMLTLSLLPLYFLDRFLKRNYQ